jgi:hypothetical protein
LKKPTIYLIVGFLIYRKKRGVIIMIKNYNKYTFEKKELKEGLKDFLSEDIFSNNG